MRTKTLLIAAAALVAGIVSSEAQVYSANVVGYVSIPLTPNKYSLVNPALDVDGTGTNGTISTVLGTNIASGTTVLVFNGAGYDTLLFAPLTRNGTPVWNTNGIASPNYPLNVGQGFWIQDPTDTNITLTGTVLQGSLTNNYVKAGGLYSLLGPKVPISGGLTTTLNYQPNSGDTVLIYSNGGYNTFLFAPLTRNGTPVWNVNGTAAEPQITVGQGFWLQPSVTTNWIENFIVQ